MKFVVKLIKKVGNEIGEFETVKHEKTGEIMATMGIKNDAMQNFFPHWKEKY